MELAVIAIIVGAAALYLGGRAWHLFRPAGGSGGGCCGSAKAGCPATKDMAERIRAAVRVGVPPRS